MPRCGRRTVYEDNDVATQPAAKRQTANDLKDGIENNIRNYI
jgi:hypothetical protein